MKTGMRLLACIVATVVMTVAMVKPAPSSQRLRGTLVIAVPLREGLVTCADKRLFNIDTGTYTDNNIKIRRVSNNVLFVATSTVAFYDLKTKKVVFDAFDVTANYILRNSFAETSKFWDGLKTEIRTKLRDYFASRDYAEWPETDKANNNLLFNLIFYSADRGVARSHTLQVFYEKRQTPVVSVVGPLSENVRLPKLSGKSRDLMNFLSHDASLSSDPEILKFDEERFDIERTSIADAVGFARSMFRFMNTKVPQAQVSSTFDCAQLSYQHGFRWIEGGPKTSTAAASRF